MWRKRSSALTVLLVFFMTLLGYFCGYLLLPQAGLARTLKLDRLWLATALPFSGTLADAPILSSLEAAVPLKELLNPSALPATTTLELPAAADNPAAGTADPLLPLKGDPRLIVMEGDSIAAYAQAETKATEPRILVYCTHSSEEYSDGARGGVHTVAQKLTENLNALGLPAIYCDTIHDYPDWNLSYANSLKSIQTLAEAYPSLEMFIDVHRDSAANSTLMVNGSNMARMMLVVGSDQRLPHPNWQQNRAFSERVKQALEAQTPGITRGVSVQPGRYNQQISPEAILVEIGSTNNSTAEAIASAGLLAEAIAKVLK